MAVTHIQSGTQYHRINREPLDADFVQSSYNDLIKCVKKYRLEDPAITETGSFYPGLFTAVTDDSDDAYNGPYYISKEDEESSYLYKASRLASSYELNSSITYIQGEMDGFTAYVEQEVQDKMNHIEDELYDTIFGWGHL